MTREEIVKSRSYQTGKAAVEYAYGLPQSEERRKYCIEDFEAGVEWADAHPKNLWKYAQGDDLPKFEEE